MAVSSEGVSPGTRSETHLAPSSSPVVIDSPRSPPQSLQTIVEPPLSDSHLDVGDSSGLSRSASRTSSYTSDYSGISTAAIKSGRHATFSEEKEVVLTRDGIPSSASTLKPDNTIKETEDDNSDRFMRAIRTRLGSVGGPDAFAPSPTRAESSAALELEDARRVSQLLATGGDIDEIGPLSPDQEQDSSPNNESNLDRVESSNSEASPHEGVIYAAARKAQMNRPRMIEHRPSKRGNRPEGKAAKIIGETPWEEAQKEQDGIVVHNADQDTLSPKRLSNALKRMSINHFPPPSTNPSAIEMAELQTHKAVQEPTQKVHLAAERAALSSSGDEAPVRRFSIINALRSNPPDSSILPKRAATAPTRRKRKPTFVMPERIDTELSKRFSRENVPNTPYPPADGKAEKRFQMVRSWREGTGYEGLREQLGKKTPNQPGISESKGVHITVILYSRGHAAPAIGDIFIPHSAYDPDFPMRASAQSAKTPSPSSFNGFRFTKQAPTRFFDDETLFRTLRAKYLRLRGPVRAVLSARILQGVRLLSYRYLSSLSDRETTQGFLQSRLFQGYGLAAEDSIEIKMETLLLRPRLGRGKEEVVTWVGRLCEEGTEAGERVAVCFVEGWSLGRIGVAFVVVLVVSFVIALVWMLVGVGGGIVVHEDMLGFREDLVGSGKSVLGAGGRVEGGSLLGLLVLFLGWTCLVGWAALSWLVM